MVPMGEAACPPKSLGAELELYSELSSDGDESESDSSREIALLFKAVRECRERVGTDVAVVRRREDSFVDLIEEL